MPLKLSEAEDMQRVAFCRQLPCVERMRDSSDKLLFIRWNITEPTFSIQRLFETAKFCLIAAVIENRGKLVAHWL
jgi:hypothetical protein